MGGCCCSQEDGDLKTSYDEAWQIFNRVLIDNSYKGPPNKQKIFQHLYFSVIIPIQQRVLQQVRHMITVTNQKKTKNDLKQYLQQKSQELTISLRKLSKERLKVYQQLKKIKTSLVYQPAFPSSQQANQKKILKLPMEDKKDKNIEKHQEIFHIQNRMKRVSSSIKSQIVQSVRFEEDQLEYSIPLSALGADNSFEDKALFKTKPEDFENYSKQKLIEILQFQIEKRQFSQEQVQKISNTISQLQANQQKLKKNNLKNQEIKKNLIAECMTKNQSIEDLKIRIEELNTKIQDYKQQLGGLGKQNEKIKMNKIIENRLNQSSELSTSNSFQPSKIHRLQVYKDLQIQIYPHFIKKQNNLEKHQSLRSFLLIQKQQPMLEQQIQMDDNQKKYYILFNLFSNSKILPNHLEFQSAVGTRTIISQMFSGAVANTELLFSFDEINPLHYNKYISNKSNLLLLIKLKNGVILGAFAGQLIQDNQHSQSFIFSISSKREPTKLIPSRRIKKIDSDNSYIVFGMGELRIKAKTLELFCNLGCLQSVYTHNNRNVRIQNFLETSQRSLTMQSYEIHQIHFQN